MNIQVNIGTGRVLAYKFKRSNVQEIPTACVVDIFSSSGDALVEGAVATIGADGTMSYEISSAAAEEFGKSTNFRIVWKFDVGADPVESIQTNQLFDIVGYTLDDLGIDDDRMVAFAPYLSDAMYNVSGIVSAASVEADELVDSGRDEVDDFYKGGVLEIFAGTGEGQDRKIVSFSDGTFTVDKAFTTLPDTTSKYLVYRSYQVPVQVAYEAVCERLLSIGINPSLSIDSKQLSQLIMTEAAKSICFGMIRTNDDAWKFRFETLSAEIKERLATLKINYDEDDSGVVEDKSSGKVVWRR